MTDGPSHDERLAAAPPTGRSWSDSARRIVPLAWPVFVGQLAVLAFSTIDTLLVARSSATDLAALAVGSAIYVTVFIGFMGVLMALAPIIGQLYGARRLDEVGRQVHQGLWLAVALTAIGCAVLLFPQPFLMLARSGPEVSGKVQTYLQALAFALPATLLFTVYRALNTAVGRPKAVMAMQVGALLLKLPLSTALVFGVPALGLPPLGVLGCGIATALAMWAQVLGAWVFIRRDDFYAPFRMLGRGLDAPDRSLLAALLRLGLPMGASIAVEVTGFVFMAIFIARLGTTPVAGHQIAANLVSVMFMMPLAVANATGTLVAQSIGAGWAADARRLGWHGLLVGCGAAAFLGCIVFAARLPVLRLYTQDGAVIAAAMPLAAWVAVFHVADAAQTIAAFVLRAYKIATLPMVVYVAALWGVGLTGGYVVAFDVGGGVPPAWQGARGFWMASTVGLVLAGGALSAIMVWVLRRQGHPAPRR